MHTENIKITAQQLAQILGGSVEGNPDAVATKPGRIEAATEGDICFFGNPQYEDFVYSTKAAILLVPKSFVARETVNTTMVRVENVYESLAVLLDTFKDLTTSAQKNIISERASIDATAKIGENVAIGDFCVVEANAEIGDNTVLKPQTFVGKSSKIGKNSILHSGARVYHDVVLGARCIVHANAVLGADGFGFAPQKDGSYKKIQHVGNVWIGDDVEIGANCTIDRGSIGATTLQNGVKLDNLVHVAHNVSIGANTVIAAQTGISGSAKIGANCMIGGQVGVNGHITIADGAKVGAQSGVVGSLEANEKVFGTPALPYSTFMRAYAIFKKLPDMAKKIAELEKKINPKND